jgi:hypothetical protein
MADELETVAELWKMRCPKCQSDKQIHVVCMTSALLTHDGTEEYGDSEWGQDSRACCEKCQYAGQVRDFDTEGCNVRLEARERDTVMAALRFWQRVALEQQSYLPEWPIAENGREGSAAILCGKEIDDLCERSGSRRRIARPGGTPGSSRAIRVWRSGSGRRSSAICATTPSSSNIRPSASRSSDRRLQAPFDVQSSTSHC